VLAAIAGFRAVIMIAFALITGHWDRIGMELLAVAVAAAGGASGGLAYVYLSAPLRRVPIVGPYLAGIVTIGSCLAIMLLLLEHIAHGKGLPFSDIDSGVAFILGTLLGGTVFGHLWFRDV
jgi:hypothetical protein